MGDEDTARTLILVAAILQIFVILGFGGLAIFFFVGNALIYSFDPTLPILTFGWTMVALFLFLTTASFFLMIVWFVWRSQPSQHRTALIITGILGLLTSVLPGILVIVAGAIAPSSQDVIQHPPKPTPSIQKPGPPRNFCGHCGAPILNPNARFCETCGTRLT